MAWNESALTGRFSYKKPSLYNLAKTAGEISDYIGSGINRYTSARDEEGALNRELESQTKRESRGMKKGGAVRSASSRGDGIAQRGNTRGRMV